MSDYSRGDYADLPAGTTDLENNYSAPDLTAIASNDNSTYAEQTANNQIAIHQYKKTVTGQYTNITWSGKSSLAPSESPVIMEVYNVDLTAWEELDRDDSTAVDTDFDLSYDNLATADYLDSGVITWLVYQAASAAGFTALASDAFTGVDATAIADHTTDGGAQATYCDITVPAGGSGLTWTKVGDGTITIQSNRVQGSTGNDEFAYINPGQNIFQIRAMIYGATGSGLHVTGLIIRWTDNNNYISCYVNDDPVLRVIQTVSGSPTTLYSGSISTFTGKLMEAVVSASALDIYYDGVKQNTSPLAIDGSLTSNNCGVRFNNAQNPGSIDNFLVYA